MNLAVRQSQPEVDQNTGSASSVHFSEVPLATTAEGSTVAPPKLDEMPAEAGAVEIIEVVHQQSPEGSAGWLLRKANNLMAERGKQYDKPEGERSMGKAVDAFNIITGHSLSEAEGWLLMQILKDVRQWQRPGYHADSAEDCIAYAALKAEAKGAGK